MTDPFIRINLPNTVPRDRWSRSLFRCQRSRHLLSIQDRLSSWHRRAQASHQPRGEVLSSVGVWDLGCEELPRARIGTYELSYPPAQNRSNQDVGIQNDGFAAHATTDTGFLGVLARLRVVLNSATTASTSILLAASKRSKVLLAFFNAATSASAWPWVGMK